MRAPFTSDSPELCPDDKDIINSDGIETQTVQTPLERNYLKMTAFGISLEDLMGTNSEHQFPQIPFILSRLCKYIEKYGLNHRSLFIEGEERSLVESLKIEFIESGDAPLENAASISSIARLLIVFFEDLPEPLISELTQNDLIQGMQSLSLNSQGCIPELKFIVEKLPCKSYQVLKYLSRFLLKVSSHQEENGMTTDSLAVIFVPVLFRPSTSDPHILLKLKEIMSCFVNEYHAIFENCLSTTVKSAASSITPIQQTPLPSTVMPVTSLPPLRVVIPIMDLREKENRENMSVPILLIEGKLDDPSKKNIEVPVAKPAKDTISTRKRKERRFSGEDPPQRSSSEERPLSTSSDTLAPAEQMRRCNSHEYVAEFSDKEKNSMTSNHNAVNIDKVDTYLSKTVELIDEKNHSPHPPHAKRREVESDFHQDKIPKSTLLTSQCTYMSHPDSTPVNQPLLDLNQNSFAKTTSEDQLNEEMDEDSFSSGDMESGPIPRSASCPIPKTDDDSPDSSESSSLSLSWSMLFEDSEPVRDSQPEEDWGPVKDGQKDALLSPSVEKLRRSNYYEAPLSPSAYKSYLSYRSSHLDANVPPSPPVEQEDFAKKLVAVNSLSDSMKKLTKSIHSIKRKIKKFDDKFEAEFGYKPSHSEKSNNPEAKKLLTDLYKARKELKVLKEDANLEHVSTSNNWRASRYNHILGDTTNQFGRESQRKSKPLLKDLFSQTLKTLAEQRKAANRPENVEDMTSNEVKEEKLAIQKALLEFESIHGRPIPKEERSIIRPLYERYRSVKKILVRSGSFTGSGNDLCGELTPILEHETMDFPIREYRADKVPESEVKEESMQDLDRNVELHAGGDDGKGGLNFTAMKYDNSNLHELPLSEMIFQVQKAKSERRHLHKIIKEFELEFRRLNGRKPSKEDKMPLKSVYYEHKHVKGRQRLLEALITKRDQHQLM